jgi:hypothetical protein
VLIPIYATTSYQSIVITRQERSLALTATPSKHERKYNSSEVATAVSHYGAPALFSNIYTFDGKRFYRLYAFHKSAYHANKELQWELKRAVSIIKREPLFDLSGQQIGEKVIATFPPKYPDYGKALLLRTTGPTLESIECYSLKDILEHEEDFNH